MAAEDGSNGALHDDTEGRYSTFIASLLREPAKQKGRRPRKYKGLRFFIVVLTFFIAYDKMLNNKLCLYSAFGTASSDTIISIIA